MFSLKRTLTGIFIPTFLCITICGGILLGTHPVVTADEPMVNELKSLVEINIADYNKYVKVHPPLDRLYRQGHNGFFLVNARELDTLKRFGTAVLSIRSGARLQGGSRRPDALVQQSGDINGRYHSYNETMAVLHDLEERFPSQAQVITIGRSIEGRDLKVIKISDNVTADERNSEANIFIVGCHHAREWISVEVPLLFARHLLEHYGDSQEIRTAVNGAQIYVMPILNPDGLEFSIHTFRLWRKNRRYLGNFYWGVDPNRNYGFMWGYDDEGSSPLPYSEVYRGEFPFSEPETEAFRQFILANPPTGVISYHNYSQLILFPWGYTYEHTPDHETLMSIAAEMSNRIMAVNGRFYEYGSSEELYLTNGGTTDWIYGTFGVPAFTFELPPVDFNEGGFITSEAMIDSVSEENIPALLYFINYFITPLNQQNIDPDELDRIKPNKGKRPPGISY
jgi:carboxypeptidase T